MQARVAQYLNEIVSLTIMGLMIVALVSAQSNGAPRPGKDHALDIVVVEDTSFRHAGEFQ